MRLAGGVMLSGGSYVVPLARTPLPLAPARELGRALGAWHTLRVCLKRPRKKNIRFRGGDTRRRHDDMSGLRPACAAPKQRLSRLRLAGRKALMRPCLAHARVRYACYGDTASTSVGTCRGCVDGGAASVALQCLAPAETVVDSRVGPRRKYQVLL